MATGTVQTTALPPAPPAPSESVEREALIRRQLARTSWRVRLVDLASGIAVWLIGVLVLFLVAALVDHFVGLGEIGRCVALAVLIAWSLWYLVMQVGPLLVRSINPAYAARTIEEATPTLKNSLINFLLLRQDRSGLKEIVYQAVERQAATDIATVPVEGAVDRSRLIYAGYVLCGVMAVLAAYKILSPKDPFQTVARVLAPWADIARPSRVQISEVEPGSAEVYHGQTVAVSATVRGVRDGDRVRVLFSTADGQLRDQPVDMKLSAGDRYECELPPRNATDGVPYSAAGLLQDVTYRIVAGDAESFPYRLTVVSAPTIIVERLEYQYPAYTKKSGDSVLQQGDIKALEGTRVTIHAIANQPIKSARIEFDPSEKEAAAEMAPLAADGQQARGTITLLLKADRQTPWHATYQVQFYNERGQRSQQPILHKLEVIRDLPPEVQLLTPEKLRIEVPENGELEMQVRAVDPDYGLASVRIEGTAVGKPPVKVELIQDGTGQPPQVTVPYAFRPSEHNLSAGDELKYAAVAEDNRTSPLTGQPEANAARTKEYTIVVTPPTVTPQSKDERGQGGQDQRPMPGEKANQGKNDKQQPADQERQNKNAQKGQPNNEPPRQADQKNAQPMNDEKGEGQQQREQQQQNQQSGNSKQQSGQQQSGQQQGGEGKGEQQQNQGQQGDKQGDKQQSDKQQQGGQSGDKQQGDKQQQGEQAGGQQKSDGQSGDQQQGQAGEKSGGGSPQQGSNQSGQRGQAGGDQQQPGGQQGESQGEGASGGDPHGQNQGKADDGRAIEEVAKQLDAKQSDAKQSENRGERPQQNGQSQKGGQKQQGEPMPDSKDQGAKGEQAGNEQGGQPQAGGKSGAQNQNVPNAGRPEGNDQQLNDQGKGQKGEGKRGEGKAGDPDNRLPDDKEGQNPSEQPSGGNKGGAPRGPTKTDKGEKSEASKGEERDPGAGKNGDEGAGAASEDKSGSGQGTRANQDRNKEMKPDSAKAEKGEESAGSNSKKQSDSKGGQSGDESGGGKQGAGQSAGQEGNDSAGSKSAADQGAGKADETGSGETGTKAGQQQKAEGQTGKSGDEAGKGSGSRGGNDQPGSGEKSEQQQGQGEDSKSPPQGDARERGKGGGSGSDPVGGAEDDQQRFQNKTEASVEQEADAANLEYARKATEMVLKHLKEEEHNPDPELLEKLGWTREDLAEFLRRWDAMQQSASKSPEGKREMDESLKSLGLRDPANRRRAGGKASDDQRGIRDAGNRSAPPPRYRELFDAFRKGAARSAP